MQGGGFGRKGLGEGAAPPQRGVIPAQRAPSVDSEMAAKRAAFIAAERARQLDGDFPERAGEDHHPDYSERTEDLLRQTPYRTAAGKKKSLMLAYVYWYFAGPVSAHRFYLGETSSAIKQSGAFFCGLIVMTIGFFAQSHAITVGGVISICLAFGWIMLDMFYLPGLCRKANAVQYEPHRIFD